jgi:regulatory protein
MAFSRPKKKSYSEDELYEYAVGALARRMRTVAELKRLMRARVEDAESEYGQTLIELVIRRLKGSGIFERLALCGVLLFAASR